MRYFFRSILSVGTVLFLFFVLAQGEKTSFAQGKPPMYITEIGAYESDDHEWIEIYNGGAEPVDMMGWTFFEANLNHKLESTTGYVLPGYSFAVIAENAVQFKLDYPQVTVPVFDSSWVSLNESGEMIGLKNKEGEFVEMFVYIGASDHSLERITKDKIDYTSENWKEHPESNTAGRDNVWSGNSEEPELAEEEDVVSSTPNIATSIPDINNDAPSTNLASSTEDTDNQIVSSTEPLSSTVTSTPTTTEQTSSSNSSLGSPNPQSGPVPVTIHKQGDIVINEFVSSPETGKVEFIELKNISNKSINIRDWFIQDASKAKTRLDERLEPNELFVIEKPKGSLNNDTDEIHLFDNNSLHISQVVYGTKEIAAPAKGQSVMRNENGAYVLTTHITKGKENMFVAPKVEIKEEVQKENKTTKNTTSSPATSTPNKTSDKKEEGTQIHIEIDKNAKQIRISEFMPNPTGKDDNEFIELYNPTGEPISLSGFLLDDGDGGSKPYRIPAEKIIKPHSYIVFMHGESGVVLNNTADQVRLFVGDELVDVVAYVECIEDASYAYINEKWIWTGRVTLGTENMSDVEVGATGLESLDVLDKKDEKENKEANVQEVSLSSVKQGEVNSEVFVRGIVTVLPGVLSTQYFYIHENAESGLEIYMYKKDFPKLALGDEVEVRGVIAETANGKRIKVTQKEHIRIIGKNSDVSPLEVTVGELNEFHTGAIAQFKGAITNAKKNYMYIDDGTGEIMVTFKKSASITGDVFETGNIVSVSGMIVKAKDGYTVVPRSKDDIQYEQVSEEADTTSTPSSSTQPQGEIKNETKTSAIIVCILIFAAAACGGYKVFQFKRLEL